MRFVSVVGQRGGPAATGRPRRELNTLTPDRLQRMFRQAIFRSQGRCKVTFKRWMARVTPVRPGVTPLELFAFVIEGLSAKVFEDGLIDTQIWPDFDAQDDATTGALAYALLDAAYLARYKNDLRRDDWLLDQGNPQWNYLQLRAASVRSLPEPGTLSLLVAGCGLLMLGLRRWSSSRVAQWSRSRRGAVPFTPEM